MTNLSELLRNINYNPHLLTNLDWREETDWFNKERIEQIISGIYGDEACDIVGEYIVIAWYEACEGDEYDKTNPKRSLMEPSWADTYVFRFNNSESKANLPGSIESYIDEIIRLAVSCNLSKEDIIEMINFSLEEKFIYARK